MFACPVPGAQAVVLLAACPVKFPMLPGSTYPDVPGIQISRCPGVLVPRCQGPWPARPPGPATRAGQVTRCPCIKVTRCPCVQACTSESSLDQGLPGHQTWLGQVRTQGLPGNLTSPCQVAKACLTSPGQVFRYNLDQDVDTNSRTTKPPVTP